MPPAYLDNASTTQPPRQVVQAMVEVYQRNYCNVHRGAYCMLRKMTALYEKVREKARAFLNAPAPEQVIFTPGTTQSINMVARSWGDANVRRGDEILLSEMEHHANIVPWQQLAAAKRRDPPLHPLDRRRPPGPGGDGPNAERSDQAGERHRGFQCLGNHQSRGGDRAAGTRGGGTSSCSTRPKAFPIR